MRDESFAPQPASLRTATDKLPASGGREGEPSAHDFHVYELIRIVDHFATAFDDLPELNPGRSDYRVLISAGMLVARFAVVGQVAPDGAVELVQLDIEH